MRERLTRVVNPVALIKGCQPVAQCYCGGMEGRERQYVFGSFSRAEQVGTWIGRLLVMSMFVGAGYMVWWIVTT
jgi:hypothetical protein